MIENGVILAKLGVIEEYLIRLNDYLPVSYDDFKRDWGMQKITERALQVMIEGIIDIAERIIARRNLLPPKTSAEAIITLQKIGVIKNQEPYIHMVRFRNIIVHDYAAVDIEILHSTLTRNLGDIKSFINEIRSYEKI